MKQETLSFFSDDNPEQNIIEYKEAKRGKLPNDLWECVTGYANAEGGTIILGVRRDGQSVGLNSSEIDKLQRDIQSSFQSIYSYRISPVISVDGSTVRVYVPPAPAPVRPVYVVRKGPQFGARVRQGSSNEKINEEWLKRFAIAAKGGAETMSVTGSSLSDISKDAVEKFIQSINKTRGGVYSGFSYVELLEKLKIYSDEGLTLFGLLAFAKGSALQDLVSPTITISVTRYSGTSKIQSDGKAYSDYKEFYGPVREQYDKAYTYIMSNIPVEGIIDKKTGLRKDEYKIPSEAIREALANSVAHRDYGIHSSKIQIDIYSDRIDFINPGISLVPLDQLEKTSSVTRNPILMNYMREEGMTEHLAQGIRKIKQQLRDAGLKEPSFQNIGNTFVATIHGVAFLNEDDKRWLEQFAKSRLNPRQLACLVHMRKEPTHRINNPEYRQINGLNKMGDDKKANKELRRLVDKGMVAKRGKSRSTHYILSEKYI